MRHCTAHPAQSHAAVEGPHRDKLRRRSVAQASVGALAARLTVVRTKRTATGHGYDATEHHLIFSARHVTPGAPAETHVPAAVPGDGSRAGAPQLATGPFRWAVDELKAWAAELPLRGGQTSSLKGQILADADTKKAVLSVQYVLCERGANLSARSEWAYRVQCQCVVLRHFRMTSA